MRKLSVFIALIGAAALLFGQETITASFRKASGGGSTVAFLNTNTSQQVTATSFSGAMTVNAGGTNVVAFVPVCYDGAASLTISAITFNGVSILANSAGTAAQDTTFHTYCQVFYYINPPTGSHTLAITGSGAGFGEIYTNLVVFQGVNQTTPIRSATYQACADHAIAGCSQVASTSATMTITSNANDLTFSCLEDGNGGTVTATNQTSDGINTNGTNSYGSDHATIAALSITDTWLFNQVGWAMAGFSIQHA